MQGTTLPVCKTESDFKRPCLDIRAYNLSLVTQKQENQALLYDQSV